MRHLQPGLAKAELLLWGQQEVLHKLNGHPVEENGWECYQIWPVNGAYFDTRGYFWGHESTALRWPMFRIRFLFMKYQPQD